MDGVVAGGGNTSDGGGGVGDCESGGDGSPVVVECKFAGNEPGPPKVSQLDRLP